MDTRTSPLALLNDPSLLKTDGLINGAWVNAQNGQARFTVNDPATGLELAQVANLGPIDAAAAIAAAEKAWPAWRARTAKERGAVLEPFVKRESSGHTLVHISDKREPVRIDAKAAFGDLPQTTAAGAGLSILD